MRNRKWMDGGKVETSWVMTGDKNGNGTRGFSRSRTCAISPLPKAISLNVQLSHRIHEGDLNSARQLFDAMPQRTVVSWNAMISGFAKWGRTEEALTTASAMHRSGMKLNETTFSSLLSACARSGSLHLGKQTHCLVFKSGSEDFELDANP